MNRISLLTLSLAVLATPTSAQVIPPRHAQDYPLHSGAHTGGAEVRLAFEAPIVVTGAEWLRLRFASAHLGRSSFVTMLAAEDAGFQILDSTSMEEWFLASAFFNGSEVLLQLWVAPGDENVFVELFDVLVGEPTSPPTESLCGNDDRVASTDNRVGRLYQGGCTAWRMTNGAFLTAGHCVDLDPDQGGPQLPDGVVDLNGVVEFNVPPSDLNGSPNLADPSDQYPINLTGVNWRFDGTGQGLGKDWGVFGVNRNSNTLLLPHEAYGFPFRVTAEKPVIGASTRITGFGVDTGQTNTTNQTAFGPYMGETFVNGVDIYHEYMVDTMGANSGSPIIWPEFNDAVIGVHTNAGCATGSGAGNKGTSFEVNALESALSAWGGSNVRYADSGHPAPGFFPTGTAVRPFPTVSMAVNAVSVNGRVSLVAGSYTQAAGNTGVYTKALLMESPTGSAVIGN